MGGLKRNDSLQIFIAASAYGGKEGYEKLWSMYEKSELQEEKVKMLVALGWTQDPSLHQKTLDAALSVSIQCTLMKI